MSTIANKPASFPQPITFGGVAGFARAPLRHLLIIQVAVALVSSACVLTAFSFAWLPAVHQAVGNLPSQGFIGGGRLHWPDSVPAVLVENAFLSVVADPKGAVGFGHASDLQLELSREEIKIRSLLGYVSLPYPRGWIISLNRHEVEPWWGAWQPAILAGLGAGTLILLMSGWAVIASFYAIPLRIAAFYSDRKVTIAGCWRVAAAALLPGAVLISAAILLYGLHQIPLTVLLLVSCLHVIVGWAYLFGALLSLPKIGSTVRKGKNPFEDNQAKRSN